ncbi:MAG: redoxin domain-containing protein [Saprospiraceae bacterium]|nr:redoxin domain-containing protein [Saprospiraceae bacterium]
MPIKKGDKAPDFTLYSSEKEQVSLHAHKGQNVLLLFFPLAFSSVCTKEMCLLRDDLATYEGFDAKVLAISVDSPYTLEKFKEERSLNFTLLSDFNKEVSRIYDSIYDKFAYGMKGVSKRSAFVIDKSGIIRYAEILKSPGDLPDFDGIRETLSKLN